MAPGRGLGAANAVAAEAVRSPGMVGELVAALGDEREVVVVRAANALKKVQAAKPERVMPFAKKILRAAMGCEVLFARWSLVQLVGALPLRGRDKGLAVEMMFEALRGEGGLLRTLGMQGLVNFSRDDAALRRRVRPVVEEFLANGTPAMRARARMLLPLVRG